MSEKKIASILTKKFWINYDRENTKIKKKKLDWRIVISFQLLISFDKFFSLNFGVCDEIGKKCISLPIFCVKFYLGCIKCYYYFGDNIIIKYYFPQKYYFWLNKQIFKEYFYILNGTCLIGVKY